MIPHSIDSERFDFLLDNGISGDELHEFFTSQKQALILAREKVQNMPKDLRAAIKRFSDTGHKVFGRWLAKREASTAFEDTQIVPRYRAAEELGVKFSSVDQKAIASQTLGMLYASAADETLLAFLRTPMSTGPKFQPAAAAEPQIPESDWTAFIRSIEDGQAGEPHGPPILRSAALLLRAIMRKDGSSLQFENDAIKGAFAAEIVRAAKHVPQIDQGAEKRGFLAKPPTRREYDRDLQYSDLLVIATRYSGTRDRSNLPWFASVDAFVDGKDVFTLEATDLAHAIPTAGEIVIHKDRGIPTPVVGEARLYEVEQMDTDFRAKVRASATSGRLLPVIRIPCESSDAPLIRRLITEFAAESELDKAVFLTTDGVCVRTRGSSLKNATRAEFDWQLDCWPSLVGFELASGAYVLDPLPRPTSTLDCSPLAKVARRLLQAASDRAALPITKAQRESLVSILAEEGFQSTELTRQRLQQNLLSMDTSGEDYMQLVDSLLQLPRIKGDIEARAQAAIQVKLAEKASETQKIDQLRLQRSALESAIKKLEEERETTSKSLKAAIRKAFTAATKREMEVLGEASLLTALFSSTALGRAEPAAAAALPVKEVTKIAGPVNLPSHEPIVPMLQMFGLNAQAAEVTAATFTLAYSSGLSVVLRGSGASEFGRRLASVLAEKAFRVFEVSLGLTEPIVPPEWLAGSDCDILLMTLANLSDVAVYAPGVVSLVVQRVLSRAQSQDLPALILTAASGPAALPWPSEIHSLGLKYDLDKSELYLAELDAPISVTASPLQAALLSKIERRALANECAESNLKLARRLVLTG